MKKPSSPTATTSSSATTISRALRKLVRPRLAVSRHHFGNVSTSSTSSSSSSTSIEAPRGCLRYILPRSKTLTHKSAKPVHLPFRDGDQRSVATKAKVSVERSGKDLWTHSAGTNRVTERNIERVLTTPVMKNVEVDGDKENGCDDNVRDRKEKTHPVQASVSPEIQCVSASAALGYLSGEGAVTPIGRPCYGAGHLLSGVIDKRECRPRGILTVRNVDNDSDSRVRSMMFSRTYCNDDNAGDTSQSVDRSVISSLALPWEASMQWLLSPLNERENEEQRRCFSGSGSEGSVTPHSSSYNSKRSKPMSISPSTSGRDSFCRNLTLASPRGLAGIIQLLEPESVDGGSLSPTGMTPIIRMVTSKEDEIPFTMDCLSDGNVILTPHSHSGSSSGMQLGRTWYEDRDEGNYAEVDLLAEVLYKVTLSPKCSCSPWDLTTDSGVGGCIDFAKVQDVVDSKISWKSTSTLDSSSQSPLRISWRDGLHSRMFEMDEYDCYRFLSDDEEGNQVKLKQDQIHPTHTKAEENLLAVSKDDGNSRVPKLIHERQETRHNEQKDEANSCLRKHCMAESMSFIGEGLMASSDSDWNLCYKNQLFRL